MRVAGFMAPVLAPINRRFGTYRGLIRLLLSHLELRSGDLAAIRNPDLSKVRRLVFVCQGNICRSCFADYYTRKLGYRAASFGLATAGEVPAFPKAIAAARTLGVDLSPHRATDVDDFVLEDGDLLLAMEVRQVRRLMQRVKSPGVQISLLGIWGKPTRPHIHDPHRLGEDYFDTCFQVVAGNVDGLVARLKPGQAGAVSMLAAIPASGSGERESGNA